MRSASRRSIVVATIPTVQEAAMTEDEKQRENLGSNDTPAAPASSPHKRLHAEIKSPHALLIPAANRPTPTLRPPTDISAIAPPKHTGAESQSGHITWRDRLKGLWFAASVFVMAQTSQPEPPSPMPTTQSEVNPQTNSHTNSFTKTEYKYSATQPLDPLSAPKFKFVQGTSLPNAVLTFDWQPEQIVEVVVHVQAEKPSEAEIKDATDYIRGFQHELHKKVLDPGYLADKVVDGGEALLGIALFKARKKIRASTHNRLVIWLCDTFERISQAFEETDAKELPVPKKRPIGFLAGRINCSTENAVAVLKLTPCTETEPGQWEYCESS